MICKAIAIYNPRSKYGLLAHMTLSADIEASLDSIVAGYDNNLADSNVSVVHTRFLTKNEAQ